jgi:DNA-binding Lrp family transcriptional regulator
LPGEFTNSAGPAAEVYPADAAVARLVTRLSTEYVLRGVQLLIETYGDIRAGLLVQAINIANVGYTDAQPALTRQAVIADGVFPDEMRRAVSVARLADSAGLPFESVRRVVQQLIDAGLCKRVPGGVIVPRATIERPENLRAVLANLGYARKFMRDLHAMGLISHVPASLAAPAGEDATWIARLVIRLSSQYFLRALQLLADAYGDVRVGIVAQTVISANTAYLDTRGGEGWRYAGIHEPPPDEARRPISINRIAESLGLPYETVRRQAERLFAANVCVRVQGGVIVPAAFLDSPAAIQAMLSNVGYARKFARDLDGISV